MGFKTDERFPPVLHFKLSPLSIDFGDQCDFNGFLDIFYYLPDGSKSKKRSHISMKHLLNHGYKLNILSGDMIERILLGLYYTVPEGALLGLELNSSFYYNGSVLLVKDKHNPLNYLEWLRSLAPGDFETELLWALGTLEAPSDKGSMETFKKWAITHQTIRLHPTKYPIPFWIG